MSSTRRDFLKTTIIAGAGASLPARATPVEPSPSMPIAPTVFAPADPDPLFTRGPGMYPGSSAENFAPTFVLDTRTYRNLALLRPANHSSSYDYNLTAQLITDGIKDTHLPSWIATSISGRGPLPINEREVFVDHFPTNVLELHGEKPAVQMQIGGAAPPAVDRIEVFLVVPKQMTADTLLVTISASDDGRVWKKVGNATALEPVSPRNYPPDLVRNSLLFYPSITFSEPLSSRFYQVECAATKAPDDGTEIQWKMGQIAFYQGASRVNIGGPYSFTSTWMSAGSGEEWVYVDLGAKCEFDRVALYWIARAAEGLLQVSDDANHWQALQPLPVSSAQVDDIRLPAPVRARYLRVLMTRPASSNGYMLSELEVYGRGGPVAQPRARPLPSGGRVHLSGGSWKVQRDNLVGAAGEALSHAGFKDDTWVIATVPGTILASYVNAGAVPEPNYSQNQLHISDSYFYSDFWYRTEFEALHLSPGQFAHLNFDGLNWKADIFLNGAKLGRIEGGFMRGRFDVTDKLLKDRPNALAVKVEKNATPGSAKQKTYENPGKNGGALGADNPTFHASIGWDWIPTIRGRNTGLWGDVSLSISGAVTLEDPLVTSTLAGTAQADVCLEVDLVNHSNKPVTGSLRGRFGTIAIEQPVTLDPSARRTMTLDPSTHPALRVHNPELWWPVGYGEPHLYDVELHFEDKHHQVSGATAFKAGIRQMTASEDGGALKLFINGRRFIARGGNWGFGESMLRYRAREYDIAVRYHREMHFTMVRNWVGQIPDDAFFEACDRHGVIVWQDFWLANPFDGPVPDDNALFLKNAEDFIRRIRRHASIGLYCGRNEGYPPPPLEQGLRKLLTKFHPGIHYIGSSADDVVSGHGPYMTLPPSTYFLSADTKLHSEIGAPTIPPIESVQAMMPPHAVWPQGLDWGLHDFTLQGAQGGTSFLTIINESYGGAQSAEEWISLAQLVNYETYRAMFEAQAKYRMGLLLWMSHPCWPSFVWQTYDYYFEPTSVYFACRKGSEPLHIQWDRTTDTIQVVNYSAGALNGLTAKAEIYNLDGAKKWSQSVSIESADDSLSACMALKAIADLTPVHFLKLTVTRDAQTLSSNFYLRAVEEGNFRAIRQLPKVQLQSTTQVERQGDHWALTTTLTNPSSSPALMIRLKAVREKSGDRILPAFYSDNYVNLLPGERNTITTEVTHADTRGETPTIVIQGFHLVAV